jgi:hypothetical protein
VYNPAMASFEKCGSCGAPLHTSKDGRSVDCEYCGAGATREVDPVALATALRAEGGSQEQLLGGLASKLADSLPDLARVERSGGFLSPKRIELLEVTIHNEVFSLKRQGTAFVPGRREVVRGIVVKTEELDADRWLDGLCAALAKHAATSARALEALRRVGRSV